MLESDVFERTKNSGAVISDATYNMVIGLVLCWGFVINWLIVRHGGAQWLGSMDLWVFLAGFFVSCFLGVYLFNTSKEPAISFIGYNFVVVPFGLAVSVAVDGVETGLVLQAVQITAGVTIVMMLMGALYPHFFQAIHTTLLIALFAALVVGLIQTFVLGIQGGWLEWVFAAIFCGYIGYDWGRANRIPKTIDNAIDSAAAIYMDIINLFLQILRILARRK